MAVYTATVTDRKIKLDKHNIAQNNIGIDTFILQLDSEWDDVDTIKVVFYQNTGNPIEIEYVDGGVNWPSEIVSRVESVRLTIVGYFNDGRRLVTRQVETNEMITVDKSGLVEGAEPSEATKDIYQSLKAAADKVDRTIDEMNVKVEAGDFNGATFTPSVSESGDISWTNDKGLVNPETVNIKGPKGDTGGNGATFTPSVSESGDISWTNDKGLENPVVVNIRGPQGAPGDTTEAEALAHQAVDIMQAHSGNYLRGDETGPLVHVEDAWHSPVRGLKVYGKSEQVQTEGKNLLGTLGRTVVDSSWRDYDKASVSSFTGRQIIPGLNATNYFNPANVTYDGLGEGCIDVGASTNGYGIGFDMKVDPSTDYTFSAVHYGPIVAIFYDSDGVYISNKMLLGSTSRSFKFTTPENAAWIVVLIQGTKTFGTYYAKNLQIELGSAATS